MWLAHHVHISQARPHVPRFTLAVRAEHFPLLVCLTIVLFPFLSSVVFGWTGATFHWGVPSFSYSCGTPGEMLPLLDSILHHVSYDSLFFLLFLHQKQHQLSFSSTLFCIPPSICAARRLEHSRLPGLWVSSEGLVHGANRPTWPVCRQCAAERGQSH